MATSENDIWTELANLPGSFPENSEKVKDILKVYYKKVDGNIKEIESTASQFPKDMASDKRIELLAKVVYADIHTDISGSEKIYRNSELSKKVLQSPEFWKGMAPKERKKAIVAIFTRALTGENNSALKAMKESFEQGTQILNEDRAFICFCVAIEGLFLKMLFKDERAFAKAHPSWSNMSADMQTEILADMPEPIINNAECEEVIAALIPVLYPGRRAEDYYDAIEISASKEVKGNVVDSKGKEEEVASLEETNPFLIADLSGFKWKNSNSKKQHDSPGADAKTPLIALIKESDKRKTKREEEGNLQKTDAQDPSTTNKREIGLMGGGALVTLALGIGLLFVPGLQPVGIGYIIVGCIGIGATAIRAKRERIFESSEATPEHRDDQAEASRYAQLGETSENTLKKTNERVFAINYGDSDTDKSGLGTSACLFKRLNPNPPKKEVDSLYHRLNQY